LLKEWVGPLLHFVSEIRMGTSVKQAVETLLTPLENEGYEIWNVEYVKEGSGKQLRVFVDREDGITIDGCEAVSRYLSERLDEGDLIGEAYSLVVSSPGMDRQLCKDEHFTRYAGMPVEVALYKGLEGRKKFAALLGRKTEDELFVTPINKDTLVPEADEIVIPLEIVSKVNLLVVL